MAQVFGSGVALAGCPAPLPRPERLDAFAAPPVVKASGATAAIGLAIAASWAAQGRDAAPVQVARADAPVSAASFAHVGIGTATFGRGIPVPPALLPHEADGTGERALGVKTVTERAVAPRSAEAPLPLLAAPDDARVRYPGESDVAPAKPAEAPVRGAAAIDDAAPPPVDQPGRTVVADSSLSSAIALPMADRSLPATDRDGAAPDAIAPRQTPDGVEFTVATRFDGVTAGRLPLLLEGGTAGDTSRVSDNISVRLDDLVDLLSARMSPELLGWLKSSRQIESYVTLNDLRAHGIAVAFDDHDRLILKSM